ncbi:MAG: hypothetical protein ACOCXJ_00350 [Planctomycetota bacterium]
MAYEATWRSFDVSLADFVDRDTHRFAALRQVGLDRSLAALDQRVDHLVQDGTESPSVDLLLVHGPIHSGKSSLLWSFAQQRDRCHAWHAVQGATTDTHGPRAIIRLLTQLYRQAPGTSFIRPSLQELLGFRAWTDAQALWRRLCSGLVANGGDPVILALDGVDEAPAFFTLLLDALQALPEHDFRRVRLRLVVGSRDDTLCATHALWCRAGCRQQSVATEELSGWIEDLADLAQALVPDLPVPREQIEARPLAGAVVHSARDALNAKAWPSTIGVDPAGLCSRLEAVREERQVHPDHLRKLLNLLACQREPGLEATALFRAAELGNPDTALSEQHAQVTTRLHPLVDACWLEEQGEGWRFIHPVYPETLQAIRDRRWQVSAQAGHRQVTTLICQHTPQAGYLLRNACYHLAADEQTASGGIPAVLLDLRFWQALAGLARDQRRQATADLLALAQRHRQAAGADAETAAAGIGCLAHWWAADAEAITPALVATQLLGRIRAADAEAFGIADLHRAAQQACAADPSCLRPRTACLELAHPFIGSGRNRLNGPPHRAAFDAQGRAWIGSVRGEVLGWDQAHSRLIPAGRLPFAITALAQAADQAIWAGDGDGNLLRLTRDPEDRWIQQTIAPLAAPRYVQTRIPQSPDWSDPRDQEELPETAWTRPGGSCPHAAQVWMPAADGQLRKLDHIVDERRFAIGGQINALIADPRNEGAMLIGDHWGRVWRVDADDQAARLLLRCGVEGLAPDGCPDDATVNAHADVRSPGVLALAADGAGLAVATAAGLVWWLDWAQVDALAGRHPGLDHQPHHRHAKAVRHLLLEAEALFSAGNDGALWRHERGEGSTCLYQAEAPLIVLGRDGTGALWTADWHGTIACQPTAGGAFLTTQADDDLAEVTVAGNGPVLASTSQQCLLAWHQRTDIALALLHQHEAPIAAVAADAAGQALSASLDGALHRGPAEANWLPEVAYRHPQPLRPLRACHCDAMGVVAIDAGGAVLDIDPGSGQATRQEPPFAQVRPRGISLISSVVEDGRSWWRRALGVDQRQRRRLMLIDEHEVVFLRDNTGAWRTGTLPSAPKLAAATTQQAEQSAAPRLLAIGRGSDGDSTLFLRSDGTLLTWPDDQPDATEITCLAADRPMLVGQSDADGVIAGIDTTGHWRFWYRGAADPQGSWRRAHPQAIPPSLRALAFDTRQLVYHDGEHLVRHRLGQKSSEQWSIGDLQPLRILLGPRPIVLAEDPASGRPVLTLPGPRPLALLDETPRAIGCCGDQLIVLQGSGSILAFDLPREQA